MLNSQEIADILKRIHPQGETFKEQIAIYARELGDLATVASRIQVHPECIAGYRGEAKKAIADLIMQMRITFANLNMNFDIDELIAIGETEFQRRIADIEAVQKMLKER